VIYFVKRSDDSRIKIGTTACLSRRLKELAKEFGDDLVVLAVTEGNLDGERGLHRRFAHLQTVGEWFEPSDDLLGFIVAECQKWDGADEARFVSVKIDAEVVAEAKMVAASRDLTLAEYLSNLLRPLVHADLEQEWERRSLPSPKTPKGKGGPR
jgi:hypothetical protein